MHTNNTDLLTGSNLQPQQLIENRRSPETQKNRSFEIKQLWIEHVNAAMRHKIIRDMHRYYFPVYERELDKN